MEYLMLCFMFFFVLFWFGGFFLRQNRREVAFGRDVKMYALFNTIRMKGKLLSGYEQPEVMGAFN